MALARISDRTCECEVDEFPTHIEVAFSEYLWRSARVSTAEYALTRSTTVTRDKMRAIVSGQLFVISLNETTASPHVAKLSELCLITDTD